MSSSISQFLPMQHITIPQVAQQSQSSNNNNSTPIQSNSSSAPAIFLSSLLHSLPSHARRQRSSASSQYFSARCSRELTGHRKAVRSVSWNHSATRIASGSLDSTIRIWSVDIRSDKIAFESELKGHTDSVDKLVWHPNNPELLASASSDKSVKLWDIKGGGRCVQSIATPGENINISWSSDALYLVVANKKNQVTLIDCRQWRIIGTSNFAYEINEIVFPRHNSELLLATTGKGTLEVYRFNPNSTGLQLELKRVTSIENHSGNCLCLDIDPRNKLIATGGADALVALYDLSELTPVRSFSRLESPIRAVSFSSDSLFLASASEDHRIDIAEVESGDLIHSINTSAEMNSIAWSPREHLLCYAAEDSYSTSRSVGSIYVFGFFKQ
jgi:THO complex subunit 3